MTDEEKLNALLEDVDILLARLYDHSVRVEFSGLCRFCAHPIYMKPQLKWWYHKSFSDHEAEPVVRL